jgi:hypothetical protein
MPAGWSLLAGELSNFRTSEFLLSALPTSCLALKTRASHFDQDRI